MESYYDIYGFGVDEIDNIAKKIEEFLQIKWVPRHSSFIGDYYQVGRHREESFKLQSNYSTEEGEWTIPEAKEYPILLYVNNTQRPEQIEASIRAAFDTNVNLLKRTQHS